MINTVPNTLLKNESLFCVWFSATFLLKQHFVTNNLKHKHKSTLEIIKLWISRQFDSQQEMNNEWAGLSFIWTFCILNFRFRSGRVIPCKNALCCKNSICWNLTSNKRRKSFVYARPWDSYLGHPTRCTAQGQNRLWIPCKDSRKVMYTIESYWLWSIP